MFDSSIRRLGRVDEAVRRGGDGRAGRGDALGLRMARASLSGRGRDRTVADRGPVVGGRPRSRVLAGRGARRRRLGPVSRPPARPLARGALVGLIFSGATLAGARYLSPRTPGATRGRPARSRSARGTTRDPRATPPAAAPAGPWSPACPSRALPAPAAVRRRRVRARPRA